MKSTLLFIDNPLTIPPDSQERWLLQDLYDRRYESQLPTITTLSADLKSGDWGEVRKVLGPTITTILRDGNSNYLVNL